MNRRFGGRAACVSAALIGGLLVIVPGAALAIAPEPVSSALQIPFTVRAANLADASIGAPAEAWSALQSSTGSAWRGTWDRAAGRIDRLFPTGFSLSGPSAASPEIDRACRAFVDAHEALFGIASDDLVTQSASLQGGVWWVTFVQTLGGIRVEGGRLDLRLSERGELLFVADAIVPGLVLPPRRMAPADAERRAGEAIAVAGMAVAGIAPSIAGFDDLGPTAEVVVPVYDPTSGVATARRAWRVRQIIDGRPDLFRSYVDQETGAILARIDEVQYLTANGTTQGDEQPATPTDPYTRAGFDDERVRIDGIGEVFSDEAGNWSADFPDGNARTAHAGLDGRFLDVQRQDGPDAQISGNAQVGLPLDLVFTDANSQPSERDAYFHANLVHDYFKNVDPNFTGTDYQMPALVNLNQTCNAYWDGYQINFFKAGGGCANTGQIADVIYHEYTHGITQFVYQPVSPDGAMNEGFSDYAAATITDQPLIGRGFTGPGTYLRTCDNDRQWPANECGGEVHCVGEVMAGCLWHMRQNLISSIGNHDQAVTIADHLYHFAKYGHSTTFEGYYFDLLAVDDDNGTLVDGTPHAIPIIQAFDRHNVGPGFVLEIIHTPMHDTDHANQPIPIAAVFSSVVPLQVDSLAVYYSTQPLFGGTGTGPTRLQMTPTGQIREYTASIPGQPLNTRVSYFISGATSEMGLTATAPDGAPANQYQFTVAHDVTAPTIIHEAKTERSRHLWPVPVVATVTDNQAVAMVTLEYSIDGVGRQPVALTGGPGNVYSGMFGGSVAVGDQVQYRIKAVDQASPPNTAYYPASGFITVPIVRDIVDDMEHGVQEWTHRQGTQGFVDQWHQDTRRNHTLGGAYSWKFGSTGSGNYSDGADGVLEMLPVSIGPGASLSFWHWLRAENDAGNQAWDGALVEISLDDGASWNPLQPIGGYPYQIIANPASPFPPGYPVWSGTLDWTQARFDLSAYAGQRIRLRWRFGSDAAVNYEGWYVDDLNLVTTTDEAAGVDQEAGLQPVRTGLLGVAPNPFNPRTSIKYAIAPGEGTVHLSIHDATGRVVRTLVDGPVAVGRHEVIWDGRDDRGRVLSTGVYFARIRAKGVAQSEKLLLVK